MILWSFHLQTLGKSFEYAYCLLISYVSEMVYLHSELFFSIYSDNHGVAQLYRRIISPSIKVHNEEWQKQTHYRHTNYKSQTPVSRLKMASPVHSVASAPGLLEASDLALQVHYAVE